MRFTSAITTVEILERMRAALADALKTRDGIAASALRSTLAAIANAEAVGPPAGRVKTSFGAGSADVPRRELSPAQVVAIIRAEIAERIDAATELAGLGREDTAERLRAEAEVLTPYVGG